MDKYIILSFQKEFLIFNQTNSVPSPDDIINSNKIFHNKYIYTSKYFNRNDKDILSIINKEIYAKKISGVYFEDKRLVDIILKFIKLLNIKNLYIKNFKALTVNQCDYILTNKYINYINCFYVPKFYMEKLNKLNKRININYVDAISDEFLNKQNIKNEDELYYKKTFHIYKDSKFKIKDIEQFFNINTHLKTIYIHFCDKDIINTVIKFLKIDGRKNIEILLYQDESNFIESNFKYLKELNKNLKKEIEGTIKIVYSSHYIKNNLFKQLSYNNLKIGIAIILYVILVGGFFTSLYNYISEINMEKLKYQMYMDSINSSTDEEEISIKSKYNFEKSFLSLNKINSDTVGWITVNDTNVNYPVVQGADNEYYLKRDFYKAKTSSGWIFMDYRNAKEDLDVNTILYGHKLKNGQMFGTLSNVLKKSWYTDKDNQIISFDTPSNIMKWKIFSIYRTNYTTEYLRVSFNTAESFDEFVSTLKSKSIYNFKEDLEFGDKILTLSTCIGFSSANQRLVVHAKLIK